MLGFFFIRIFIEKTGIVIYEYIPILVRSLCFRFPRHFPGGAEIKGIPNNQQERGSSTYCPHRNQASGIWKIPETYLTRFLQDYMFSCLYNLVGVG